MSVAPTYHAIYGGANLGFDYSRFLSPLVQVISIPPPSRTFWPSSPLGRSQIISSPNLSSTVKRTFITLISLGFTITFWLYIVQHPLTRLLIAVLCAWRSWSWHWAVSLHIFDRSTSHTLHTQVFTPSLFLVHSSICLRVD